MKMYWALNYFSIQCIILCQLLLYPQTESLIGPEVRRANEDESPYTAAIVRLDTRNGRLHFFCTGTYISRTHILTANHCVQDQLVQLTKIFVGSRDLYQCDAYEVKSWTTYEDWAFEKNISFGHSENDIAIITMNEFIDFGLPNMFLHKPHWTPNTTFTITGWGKPNNGSHNSNNSVILQIADVKILSKLSCESELSKIERRKVVIDESRYFCTAADPYVIGDHRNGDSGDPIVSKDGYLMGFLVKGYWDKERPSNRKVNLHIDIEFYNDFIRDMIKYVINRNESVH